MPQYIIKTDPNLDLYLLWTTVSEAPIVGGTEVDIIAYLDRMGETRGAAARIQRAKVHGTSDPNYTGAWTDTAGFIYQQAGFIRRDRFTELANRIATSPDGTYQVADLITPFGDN